MNDKLYDELFGREVATPEFREVKLNNYMSISPVELDSGPVRVLSCTDSNGLKAYIDGYNLGIRILEGDEFGMEFTITKFDRKGLPIEVTRKFSKEPPYVNFEDRSETAQILQYKYQPGITRYEYDAEGKIIKALTFNAYQMQEKDSNNLTNKVFAVPMSEADIEYTFNGMLSRTVN